MSDPSSPQPVSPLNQLDLLPVEILIGLATAPALVALVSGKVLTRAMNELGQLSEEVFRGDRLPLLKFPTTSPPTMHTPEAD
ncbi:hypothetical protein OsccyDRAFT_3213 [Leptolyngbyaceae cyanobacterium JSC-12]|nr:hypothetical protein OsccyDRAFT_3213 [Leptolyngbyaceae cyanobacterium JSC-12]